MFPVFNTFHHVRTLCMKSSIHIYYSKKNFLISEDQVLPSNALAISGEISNGSHSSDPHASSPQVTTKTPIPSFSESYFDHVKASKSHDSQIMMKTNTTTAVDW